MSAPDAKPTLPGRLGNEANVLNTDPRAEPRLVAALGAFKMDGELPPPPEALSRTSETAALVEFATAAEAGFGAVFAALFDGLATEGVAGRTETIKGVDGNDVTLFIAQPASFAPATSDPIPCFVYMHGGGMTLSAAADPAYTHIREQLASRGAVVVMTEFRNAAGKLGPFPFPAGLNDCRTGLEWVLANRKALGASKVVVAGESGGGNLAIASVLALAKAGKADGVDGLYACCPYISNMYHKPAEAASLTSLWENDGMFLRNDMMTLLAACYTPAGTPGEKDMLAWPHNATPDDLKAFPPTVVSVNELDPLRDEGLAFERKLRKAGIRGYSRTVNSTCHGADLIFFKAIPEVCAATADDMVSFAKTL